MGEITIRQAQANWAGMRGYQWREYLLRAFPDIALLTRATKMKRLEAPT
jgi:hypothetical protein